MVVKSFEFCAGTALYMKYKIVLPQHSCWDTIILCIMGVLMLVIPLGRGCEENQKYLPHPPFLFSAMIITVAAFLTLSTSQPALKRELYSGSCTPFLPTGL